MKAHFVRNAFLFMLVASVAGFAHSVRAEQSQVEVMGNPSKTPEELKGVGVREHLGETLPLEGIRLLDPETRQEKPLSAWFQSGKPVVLNLVYYECPMLCTMVLNGVNEGMKKLAWSVGVQFNVVTVSIDPKDTPEMALAKKQNYLKEYLKSGHDAGSAAAGWAFLTAQEDQIKKLAAALGFEYKYDEVSKEFAHSAVTFVLTPEGKISRYLYGITYDPKNLKLALLEASQGRIGSVFDRLLLFCYHYEPLSRGYSLQAMRVMQLGAMGMIAFLGGYLLVFWSRQRKGNAK
ncbi:MAG: SCO family protein [Bdellovibrionales bacterium]|nr:SCO family protein [Bdellovibrionales bacterium]